MTMPVLNIDRGTMHYDVHGPPGGEWAVILPGAFTAPWQYVPARDFLAQHFRVITLDYRGIAESGNEMWHVTPQVLANDVLALLDHLQVEETHATCFSLGTFVLAEMLHRAPERIDRCAIGAMPAMRRQGRMLGGAHEVSSMGMSGMTWYQQFILSIVPQFWSENFRKEQPARYEEAIRRSADLTIRDVWAGTQQFQGVFGHDWARTRIYGTLPSDRRLFLTGEVDPFAPLADVLEHPLYKAGPTVVFRHTGHLFFYERAELYNPVVQHFFATGRMPHPLPGHGVVQTLEAMAVAR
jgi:pimeloyl-ACP methyl ester carboxylesterase